MTNLGKVLKKYRMMSELTLRDVAYEMGISAPTLMRIESGSVPDGETLMAVFNWLMLKERTIHESNSEK